MLKAFRLMCVALMGCSSTPALVSEQRAEAALSGVEREFARAQDAEFEAVFATQEAAAALVAEARRASASVDGHREALRGVLWSAEQREALAAFDAAWLRLRNLDAKILPLAGVNANVEAARVSARAAVAVDSAIEMAQELEAQAPDVATVRALAQVSVAMARMLSWHAPHIASADAAEMTEIDGRLRRLSDTVEANLAQLESKKRVEHLPRLRAAWADFSAASARVQQLSRENSNVIATELLVHEKPALTHEARQALEVLSAAVRRAAPRPSR